jgi:hypothetical protein
MTSSIRTWLTCSHLGYSLPVQGLSALFGSQKPHLQRRRRHLAIRNPVQVCLSGAVMVCAVSYPWSFMRTRWSLLQSPASLWPFQA